MEPLTAQTPAEDDASVIRRSLGEPERFAALFDRHAPHIHRYVVRRLGADLAEDLVAETFLVAFRKRRRYHLDQPDARPWLYGIATNLVRQHRRDEARRYATHTVSSLDPPPVGHADRVATAVSAQAMGGQLATALAELAVGDRDVLLLFAWEQLSYQDIAAALGIPLGTVRSRLSRARRKVRAALGDHVERQYLKEIANHG
jgi:RNA polymerase sigma-70 factor (ECF subfamily)